MMKRAVKRACEIMFGTEFLQDVRSCVSNILFFAAHRQNFRLKKIDDGEAVAHKFR